MTTAHLAAPPAARPAEDDSAKRRQIIGGAKSVFLAQGFDGASMGEIARAAGVSKGTLYVYFQDKDHLFEAIAQEECHSQAEGVFDLDPADQDVEAALTRLGKAYFRFMCGALKLSSVRTIIGIAERMPNVGKAFYDAGPGVGIARLTAYLKAQVEAGVLEIDDCELAATFFMDMGKTTLFTPVFFNAAPEPTAERIDYVVHHAVKVFLNTYRR